MDRRDELHERLEIAKKRLSRESDIQSLIQLNRVTRLVHKAQGWSKRQERTVSFSDKFMIEDLNVFFEKGRHKTKLLNEEKINDELIQKLIDDFDPSNNEIDRQLFYMVTKKHLNEDGELVS